MNRLFDNLKSMIESGEIKALTDAESLNYACTLGLAVARNKDGEILVTNPETGFIEFLSEDEIRVMRENVISAFSSGYIVEPLGNPSDDDPERIDYVCIAGDGATKVHKTKDGGWMRSR